MKEYETIIRAKCQMDGAETLLEAAEKLRELANELEAMHNDGITFNESVVDDYGFARTTDAELAKKYDMYELEMEEE